MKRGIDHLVLSVRDLDRARALYQRLGFTLTPRAVHPFGTGNSLVQLGGNFLELAAVLDPSKIPPMTETRYSFAAFSQKFLEKRQGLSMLVLQSDDAAADLAEFKRKGLRTYEQVDFSRAARQPDGTDATVSFSLAFFSHPLLPDVGFFACQQHAPRFFWKTEYQKHANGARLASEVFMVADAPASLRPFFESLYGTANVKAGADTLGVDTGQGRVTVMTPAGLAARFPGAAIADAPETPYFAGYRVAVADVAVARALLAENKVRFSDGAAGPWLGPADAFGAVVEFAGT